MKSFYKSRYKRAFPDFYCGKGLTSLGNLWQNIERICFGVDLYCRGPPRKVRVIFLIAIGVSGVDSSLRVPAVALCPAGNSMQQLLYVSYLVQTN